jgi:hypothetical protein
MLISLIYVTIRVYTNCHRILAVESVKLRRHFSKAVGESQQRVLIQLGPTEQT